MSAETSETIQLLRWLDRMHAGDAAAKGEIIRHFRGRFLRLTRKMLQDYRRVKRWEETDDVLQNALVRLSRALENVRPATTRELFALATLQIRRELLDLAKHYYGPQGTGANYESVAGGSGPAIVLDKVDLSSDPSRLAQWCEAHEQVTCLPDMEREVFDLVYYQGLTQHEAAAILDISRDMVRRRWQMALLKLHDLLPEGD